VKQSTTHRQEQCAEIERLRAVVRKYEARLRKGCDYLMSVEGDAITVEDALEAFGWERDGMSEVGQ